jgi:hypothetical protein
MPSHGVTTMKASQLIRITDRLDREIDFAHGLVSAISALECLDDERHNGVHVLAETHIKRLRKISARLSQLKA